MNPEFEILGIYFSAIVPRFVISFALWLPLRALFGALHLERWLYFPALFHLGLFLILLALTSFHWHP
ncbi:MAG TPA: DUF1656 domain-containing protein [Haloferula sp.]